MSAIEKFQDLIKAIEAGSYNAAPSTLVGGAALQEEDLSPVMQNVTFDDKHLVLQQMLKVETCRSLTAQFNRQLSYGVFGGSAQLEGNIGQENTSDYVRITVPMAFYSEIRKATIAANMVATMDGKKADDRGAEDAAKRLGGDIEFDLFRGMADFSNAGVFDGNPLAVPSLPNMHGLDLQVRQSDSQRQAKDQMFGEFGSNDSVVISVGSSLTQSAVEDSHLRSVMNMGNAETLVLDPVALSRYNKLAFGNGGTSNMQRIVLDGSAQDALGADLRTQWVSGGTVKMKPSRFLSGKTGPTPTRATGPVAPTISVASANSTTTFLINDIYQYLASTVNEVGESVLSPAYSRTITAGGDKETVTITHPSSGTFKYFNIYRSAAGGTAASAKFIGRVVAANQTGGSTTAFVDLNNKTPGFSTGYLIQSDTMAMKQLAPFSSIELAVTDLTRPKGFYRFCSLACFQPRKNSLLDNLS